MDNAVQTNIRHSARSIEFSIRFCMRLHVNNICLKCIGQKNRTQIRIVDAINWTFECTIIDGNNRCAIMISDTAECDSIANYYY